MEIFTKILHFFEKKRKKLIWIPLGLFIAALLVLGFTFLTTGEFIQKDVSLVGGTVLTIETGMSSQEIEHSLSDVELHFSSFLGSSVSVSDLKNAGETVAYIIKTKVDDTVGRDALVAEAQNYFGVEAQFISVELTQSQFGEVFFRNLLFGVGVALVLMAFVVYFTFRRWVPSSIIIFAVISDMIVTLAIVSLLGVELSSAGIAAFLMIIGYAVDTNILLTWNMLKKPDLKQIERIRISARTGLVMTATTIGALIVALFITNSSIIFQIMLILLVGLIVDLLNTWLLNTELLWRYTDEN
jgi:preprotein translocase subunit SecF